MKITLLNKTAISKPNKTGKLYQTIEVAFKNNTFGGKVEGFKVTEYMKGFSGIAEANIGDTLDVEVVKGNSGFNEWVSVQKGPAGVSAAGAAPQGVQQQVSKAAYRDATPTPRSTYETPEERALKQKYIVRQSSIGSAINALSVGGKTPLKTDEVIRVAKEFNDWVFENAPLTGFEDMADDNLDDDNPAKGINIV
jgi:hypothetical protein